MVFRPQKGPSWWIEMNLCAWDPQHHPINMTMLFISFHDQRILECIFARGNLIWVQ